MKNLSDYKVILWDFDGVILDSMPIREKGFRQVLQEYPEDQVEKLIQYHQNNGGLSRYVKFRYFFENIRKEQVSSDQIDQLTKNFSDIMLKELPDKKYLIEDSFTFIKRFYRDYEMHIVSGSDQTELRQLCEQLNIAKYFMSINGSPTSKNKLVRSVLKNYFYDFKDVVLIGDSVNDLEAANAQKINFFGYNNESLKNQKDHYLKSFKIFIQ